MKEKKGQNKEEGKSLKELFENRTRKIDLVEILNRVDQSKKLIKDAEIINTSTKQNQFFLIGNVVRGNFSEEEIEKRIEDGTLKTKEVEKRVFKGSEISVMKIW